MSQSQYLQVAIDAVRAAERIIQEQYATDIQATRKSDQSPVTIADRESEKIIREHIARAFPEHNILGEEEGKGNGNSPYLWIIDPIDGTKNFMRKIPLFATQLALMNGDQIILGVSNAPILGELLCAEKGAGAYCNGERIHVSAIDEIGEAYVSHGGIVPFEEKGLLDPLVNLQRKTLAGRGFGDCWSYHLLAQGKVDIVVEAKVKIWDIAALSLIVEEAGGKVTDIAGNPIGEQTTSIIATNGHFHELVRSYFQ